MKGDLNSDGSIHVADVQRLVNHILGINVLDVDQEALADINSDGSINVADVQRLVNHILDPNENGGLDGDGIPWICLLYTSDAADE